MTTYRETVYRFQLLESIELPEEHKAEYRRLGLDPNENWSLKWSFLDRAAAEEQLANEQERAKKYPKLNIRHKIVDAGETQTIERQAW